MGGGDTNLLGSKVNSGGAEEARTPDPLLANRITLDSYLNSLKVRNCSDKYIGANKRFLLTLVNTFPIINEESALQYLGTFNDIGANSRARYGGMLKGLLNHMGMSFDTKFKRPKLLPQRVLHEDVEKLKDTIRNKKSHKKSAFRDLILIETAIKTGMRRGELANLLVSHIAFEANRIIVMNGKGAKDRTIPMGDNLKSQLLELCAGKKTNEKVFGFKAVSLGMKIKEWGDKAGVPIKAHSLRHYFATNLMERGANIKQVQELLGHESLATTQIYLSLMADHLEDAIQLLE
ncbi:MAG TPA: tyrosine-type recombinase/integrase [SAR202 cluster bacterium]|nr:tyrosine-type recombinase/integrase [SAR202 cluster bacterium]